MDLPNSIKQLGNEIQNLRREIPNRVDTLLYRFDVLAALTPIDFKLVSDGTFLAGTKIGVRATLTNRTDRIINGKVKLRLPSEWTARELSSATIKMPAFSKSIEVKFEVTIPKTAEPGTTITADADLMVEDVQVKLFARTEMK